MGFLTELVEAELQDVVEVGVIHYSAIEVEDGANRVLLVGGLVSL